MSEEQMAGGQPVGASGAEQVTESSASGASTDSNENISRESYKKAVEQDRRSRAAKQRFEVEATEWKAKAEALEAASLEEQGKFREMYEKQLQKSKELEDELNNTLASTAMSNGLNAAKIAARDAGCSNLALFERVVDISTLDFDDNLNPVDDQLKSLVDESRKQFPEIFSKAAPTVANHNIGQQSEAPQNVAEELGKMSKQELAAFAMRKGIK